MRDRNYWPRLMALMFALGLTVAGCATLRAGDAPSTEELLVAAGFHVHPAEKPEQLARLKTLPAWKLVRIERDGAPYYASTRTPARAGAWGTYGRFVEYTARLNWFLPAATIPALAMIATAAETVLGLLLVLGWNTRIVALLSGALLATFALR